MPAVTHNSLAAYGNHGICAGAALAQQGAAACKLPGPADMLQDLQATVLKPCT